MRVHIGELPKAEETSPQMGDWRAIRSPGATLGYALAAVGGLFLLGGLCGGLSLFSLLIGDNGVTTAGVNASWVVVLVVLVVYIPLHELLHLLGQPGWGRSNRSVVVVWPARLRFGVYYEGCMPRRQWLAMRLAPLIVLSVLPAGLLALSHVRPLTAELDIGLQILLLVNTLGSGGDLVAAVLVLAQVPATGQLCFREGRAYWRTV